MTHFIPQTSCVYLFIYLSTFKTFSRALLCQASISRSAATKNIDVTTVFTATLWSLRLPVCVPGELKCAFTQCCVDLSCQSDLFKGMFSIAAYRLECHVNDSSLNGWAWALIEPFLGPENSLVSRFSKQTNTLSFSINTYDLLIWLDILVKFSNYY